MADKAAPDLRRSLNVTREVAEKLGINKHVGFVLIKLNTVFGPAYILENRKNDTSFNGKLALYGGGREGTEEFSKTAVEELKEETGIVVGDGAIKELLFFVGTGEREERMAGAVFLLEYEAWPPFKKDRPSCRKIRQHKAEPKDPTGGSKNGSPATRSYDSEYGSPVLVRKYFGLWWFGGWARLTPLTGYALLNEQRSKKSNTIT